MSQGGFEFPKPLVDKYAPEKIEEFVGLEKVKRVIVSFLKRPVECSWLFYGRSGLGKSQMAKVMANLLNAQWHHIPAAKCDLETIENECRLCHYVPFNFKSGYPAAWHVIQVDEIDRATAQASLALLSKTDRMAHPPQTIFIFTSNSLNLEARFLSRCRKLPFDAAGMETELPGYLARIATAECSPADIDFVALAKNAEYNVRDAMNQLEIEILADGYREPVLVGPPEPDPRELLRQHFNVQEYGENWRVHCRTCKRSWPCELPLHDKSVRWLMNHFATCTKPC